MNFLRIILMTTNSLQWNSFETGEYIRGTQDNPCQEDDLDDFYGDRSPQGICCRNNYNRSVTAEPRRKRNMLACPCAKW